MDEKLARMLEVDEGAKLFPYRCTSGKWTIGIGRNLQDRGITIDEARYLLKNDIQYFKQRLEKYSWYQRQNEARQCVLVNMAFNLGLPGLLKFSSMIGALSSKDYAHAAREMLNSRWATQVKGRAERLAKIMETGVFNAENYTN